VLQLNLEFESIGIPMRVYVQRISWAKANDVQLINYRKELTKD
jgi:hypothetical protein